MWGNKIGSGSIPATALASAHYVKRSQPVFGGAPRYGRTLSNATNSKFFADIVKTISLTVLSVVVRDLTQRCIK